MPDQIYGVGVLLVSRLIGIFINRPVPSQGQKVADTSGCVAFENGLDFIACLSNAGQVRYRIDLACFLKFNNQIMGPFPR